MGRGDVTAFASKFSNRNYRFVVSHNDLLPSNILFNEEKNSLMLTDYEEVGPNGMYFDLADMLT